MQTDAAVAAYLAGAFDSDGTIGIRRSTYAQRVRGDAGAPVYSERIGLKQVTPQIPELLRETFGGSLMIQRSSTTKGRPLHYWEATNRVAAEALRMMLPHLRIKLLQAEACLALRASKDLPRSEQRVQNEEPSISRNRWGDTAIRRWVVAPHVLAERERLYLLVKELNRVGA
ncbi:hypothetical protein ACF061_01045 [Streptomyces sp. NPDC015220]|uniref:hypothetical protein n=1 Tax=Streptomyces sp. NPDC015220 TaxID=3364947 RepID=UPI0036F94AF9